MISLLVFRQKNNVIYFLHPSFHLQKRYFARGEIAYTSRIDEKGMKEIA